MDALAELGARVHLAHPLGVKAFSYRRVKNDERDAIDLIVERADRRIVALEVKLARTVDDRDVRHLNWLAATMGDNLLDAVVVTTWSTTISRRRCGPPGRQR